VALVPVTGVSAGALTQATCLVGVANQSYNPPVTYAPQPTSISVNSHYGSCASLTHPTLTYGDTSIGTVVAGKLAGARVVRVVVYATADFEASSTTGLSHSSRPVTLTINRPVGRTTYSRDRPVRQG
jgi:hypothetical protein